MTLTEFRGRKAVRIENEWIRATVTVEGGHIAELREKTTGVNPLWIPPWPSIEISAFSPSDTTWGSSPENKLLCGIMGHNLCLDMFGPPSPDEENAGVVVHGEAGIAAWEFGCEPPELAARCRLPSAQLGFERRFRLEGPRLHIRETVENLSPLDRPIAWTQHVTLGPPFLERGSTQFRASVTRSCALGCDGEFLWPFRPSASGQEDLRVFTSASSSSGYTAHLTDDRQQDAWFWAWSPKSSVLMGYVWRRADFPWLGIWEENCSRLHAPWNARTITRGMEFGVSPFPETRQAMITRGSLLDTPGFRWIGGGKKVSVEYYATAVRTGSIPESLTELADAVLNRS